MEYGENVKITLDDIDPTEGITDMRDLFPVDENKKKEGGEMDKINLLTFGSTVRVPSVKGNISMLNRIGIITVISPPKCRVKIKYENHIGYWTGLINDVELIPNKKT